MCHGEIPRLIQREANLPERNSLLARLYFFYCSSHFWSFSPWRCTEHIHYCEPQMEAMVPLDKASSDIQIRNRKLCFLSSFASCGISTEHICIAPLPAQHHLKFLLNFGHAVSSTFSVTGELIPCFQLDEDANWVSLSALSSTFSPFSKEFTEQKKQRRSLWKHGTERRYCQIVPKPLR